MSSRKEEGFLHSKKKKKKNNFVHKTLFTVYCYN